MSACLKLGLLYDCHGLNFSSRVWSRAALPIYGCYFYQSILTVLCEISVIYIPRTQRPKPELLSALYCTSFYPMTTVFVWNWLCYNYIVVRGFPDSFKLTVPVRLGNGIFMLWLWLLFVWEVNGFRNRCSTVVSKDLKLGAHGPLKLFDVHLGEAFRCTVNTTLDFLQVSTLSCLRCVNHHAIIRFSSTHFINF